VTEPGDDPAAAERSSPTPIVLSTSTVASPYVPQPQTIVIPNAKLATVVEQREIWQGPFPPPDAVEQYEKVLPGVFDRLVKMAEESQVANVKSIERAQEFTRRDIRRGHWLGWATTIAAMAGTVVCAYLKQPWLGGMFLTVPVMAVAKSFISSEKGQKLESSSAAKKSEDDED
jgi:uncharacterized membrane protein